MWELLVDRVLLMGHGNRSVNPSGTRGDRFRPPPQKKKEQQQTLNINLFFIGQKFHIGTSGCHSDKDIKLSITIPNVLSYIFKCTKLTYYLIRSHCGISNYLRSSSIDVFCKGTYLVPLELFPVFWYSWTSITGTDKENENLFVWVRFWVNNVNTCVRQDQRKLKKIRVFKLVRNSRYHGSTVFFKYFIVKKHSVRGCKLCIGLF